MNKSWQRYGGIYCFLGHWAFSSGGHWERMIKGKIPPRLVSVHAVMKALLKKKKHLWVSEGLGGCTLNYFLAYCPGPAFLSAWISSETDERIRACKKTPSCLSPSCTSSLSRGSWQKRQLAWLRHQKDQNIMRSPATSWGVHVSHELSVIGMMKGCIGHME